MLSAVSLGCDAGAPTFQPFDLPPIHIVDVQAATAFADGAFTYESVAANGSTKVLPTTAIKIRFDRYLLPVSAIRQAICVQPLLNQVHALSDCPGQVFLEPSYDPIRREVVYRQSADSGATLIAGDAYALTTLVAINEGDTGFRAFDGSPVELPFQIQFGVLDADPSIPFDLAPTVNAFCTSPKPTCASDCTASCNVRCAGDAGCAGPCASNCQSTCPRSVSAALGACARCHGGASTAAEGLDLSSAAALLATALGKVAHEAQTGENATMPNVNSPRFGRAMPVLDPGSPGNSFLVYKLATSVDNAFEYPPEPAEIARLRSQLAVGMPMPPSNAPAERLRALEPEWIGAWLQQGAQMPSCD